ncbi:MAG: lantibiotic dehydratase [Alphaproteobacteria bacterium]|nr:lantibiotic dehydratase [Alphaproteobacteria bacterium]
MERPWLPHHRGVPGATWRYLPWAIVRMAGFRFDRLLPLAAPRTASALDAGVADAQALFEEELTSARAALRAAVSDARVVEAIGWSSPAALEGIQRLHDGPLRRRNKRDRQREATAVMFLQRLCAKNDTIGFFGPRDVAGVEGPGMVHVQGSGEEEREVFLEHWAIAALAEAMEADPALSQQLRPRRSGRLYQMGTRVWHPGGLSVLDERTARVLAACDGQRTVAEIQDDDALGRLERAGLLRRTPVVPTCTLKPEAPLRAFARGLPANPARERWTAALDALEQARIDLRDARGPEAVDAARGALFSCFTRHAGRSATRGGGQVYEGRQICWMDARRDLSIRLGDALLARLAPLALVYDTLVAFSADVWAQARPRLAEACARGVPLATLLADCATWLPALCAEGLTPWQDAWRRAVDPQPGARRVTCTARQLAGRLSIPEVAPGWPSAGFMSPDVMLTAPDLAALQRGAFEVVVGELHAHRNMLAYPVALALHPAARAAASAAFAKDHGPFLRQNVSRAGMMRATRFVPPECPELYMVDRDWPPPHVPAERLLAEAELVTGQIGDALIVQTRDGRLTLPLRVALDGAFVSACGVNQFPTLPGPHAPRVTVDGVVLARETWRVPAPRASRGLDAFRALRLWARDLGLPRFFFVSSPLEAKPFLVDQDNPLLVEALARAARKTERLTLSEMLPGPDQLWLPGDGGAVTCELRLCALSPRIRRGPRSG